MKRPPVDRSFVDALEKTVSLMASVCPDIAAEGRFFPMIFLCQAVQYVGTRTPHFRQSFSASARKPSYRSSELQAHRIAFPLWVFAFTLGFPTIFPTNAPNLRKTSRYILKHINTRRSPNPLQHRGLGDLTWHEWVHRKRIHGFLVRMRSAVRIRPAAPTFSALIARF